MIIRHKTLFQRNDHLNQENLEHSLKTYIRNARNGDSVWFQVDFHYFIHVFWTKCIEILCIVSGFMKILFLNRARNIIAREP